MKKNGSFFNEVLNKTETKNYFPQHFIIDVQAINVPVWKNFFNRVCDSGATRENLNLSGY